ncbi:MAG: aminopeptidase N [Proteobacteria bacterium]|nr:aminopeptidase N [Pseudomonadota bacterium]
MQTTRLADYTPYPYQLLKADLDIKVFDGRTDVKSVLRFKAKAAPAPLVLNYKDMDIKAMRLDGAEIAYTTEGETLTITAVKPEFVLEIENSIVPEDNKSCAGFYANEARDLYSTQCEAEDFRRITPFPDRPDVLTIFTVRVEAEKAKFPSLLSNGNLKEVGDMAGGRHFAVWHDPHPKPCYLFALVVANLVAAEKSTFKTMNGREVELGIYTRKPDADQCAFAMDALKRAMKWDEDTYGREYDLDVFNIVAVHDFNMGAMENKGLNIFNTKLVLSRPDLTTDSEYINIDRVIAHEYFHNWSGNRVTCRDWFQLSLKEGFTVFRENQYGKDTFNYEVERIGEVRTLKGHQFVEDAGSMAHPVQPKEYMEINNFYTLTVYEKGGEVIGMYKTLLGDATYRRATDLYFDRHDGQAATIEDFLKCMEDASGRDLKSQFRHWYDQAGTPTVKAEGRYDAAKKQYVLSLSQDVPYGGKPMLIPVKVGLVGGNGQDVEITNVIPAKAGIQGKEKQISDFRHGGSLPSQGRQSSYVLELSNVSQEFIFENVGDAHVVPSILRNFSAPVNLVTNLSEAQLRFLMVHDSDGVNKWEAGQTLYLKAFERCLDAYKKNVISNEVRDLGTLMADPSLKLGMTIEALSNLIENLKDTNRGLLAEMLALPDDGVLTETFKPADPQGIQAVRDHLGALIGQQLSKQLIDVYTACAPKTQGFEFDEAAIARRALRNIVLGYLTAGDADTGAKLAQAQYDSAPTMTERLGALAAVKSLEHPAREALLADFYARFKDYPLVIDRWFAIQASANRKSVIADVRRLAAHPDYTLTNPNRARSLFGIAGFGGNLAWFHEPTGEGYRLLAEYVLKMDAINEQLAARILGPFKGWRAFDAKLHPFAKAALQSILDASGQRSAGVYEIVSKSLKD